MDNIKISFNGLKYFFFVLALYLYIYNPPFASLPLMPIELLSIVAFVYLTIFRKWLKMIKTFKGELTILILIILYCFFRELFIENAFFKVNIFLLLQVIVIPYFLVIFYSKIRTHNNLLKDVILCGSIAAILTLLMLIIPSLAEVIRYRLLATDDFTELIAFRSFGVSEGLTFAYGTAQGIIFALVLFYAKDNPKYYLILPLILISIIFNARIGLVPVVFSIIYFVILKFNLKIISIITGFGLSFYFVLFKTSLFLEYATTIEWAFDFFIQSSDFLTGSSNSSDNTFDTLFGKMAILPEGKAWLIGTGENIFFASTGNSDVGYIIQLNYGGIIYVCLLFSFVIFMLLRLKFLYTENRWLIFLFLVTIVLTNIKGLFISIIPSFRLIALIYCYLIFEYKTFKQIGGQKFNLKSFVYTRFNPDNEQTKR
jgi:hypothetical protein